MIDVPCKGCLRRRAGCHSVCLDYAEYKAAKIKLSEQQRKDAQAFNDYMEIIKKKRGRRL